MMGPQSQHANRGGVTKDVQIDSVAKPTQQPNHLYQRIARWKKQGRLNQGWYNALKNNEKVRAS